MRRTLHTVASLLAIVIILAAMYLIVIMIHYAIFGNPIHDAGHLINDIRGAF